MGKTVELASAVVQFKITSDSEKAEEFGSVLAQLRGVSKEMAVNMKTFRLDLSSFNGEVPEKYDGVAVELTFDPANDRQTDEYKVPASFKVLEIVEGAYLPTSEPSDVQAYLRELGIIK
jgi:hypothetical protein